MRNCALVVIFFMNFVCIFYFFFINKVIRSVPPQLIKNDAVFVVYVHI